MSSISKFCEQRGIPPKIEELFTTYCRASFANRFSMRNGDTVNMLVSKMTEDEVLDEWVEFVRDLKAIIQMPINRA